jgi:dynactin-5
MISSFSEPIPVTSTTYQTTSSGNLISTRARIYGATSIVLHGRNVVESGVILRGDLRRSLLGSSAAGKSENDGQMSIVMGRYCRIGEDSVIRPPGKMTKGYV